MSGTVPEGPTPEDWLRPADAPMDDASWWGLVEFALLDRDGVIVSVNRAWDEFSRHNGGDPGHTGVGVSFLAVCEASGDPAASQVADTVRAALRGELSVPLTSLVPCHSPTERRWFDLLVSSRYADDGACIGALVTVSPAVPTSRATTGSAATPPRAAAASRRAMGGLTPLGLAALDDPSLWSLVEGIADGLAVTDSDGHVVYVNRQLEILTGYERADLLGGTVELLVPSEARPRHEQLHSAYRKAPTNRIMGEGRELELQCADGRAIPVEVALSGVRIAGRSMTVASVRDVRAQRDADRLRQRTLATLDLIPDAVLVLDAELRVVYGNAAAARMRGCEPEQLLSLTMADLDPTLSPDQSPQRATRLAPDEAEEPATRETMLRRTDGTAVPCEVLMRIIDDPELGRRRVVVARDITARRARELTRSRQARAAELTVEVTTAILSGASSADTYRLVVEGAAGLLDAEDAAVLLPDPVTETFVPAAGIGQIICGISADAMPTIEDMDSFLLEHENGAVLPAPRPVAHASLRQQIGPIALAPMGRRRARRGLLGVGRPPGARPFTDEDRELLASLATQVALAVELGQARIDQQRLALLEDRQRIARDLHDTVIQDLIAIGMQLASVPAPATAPEGADAQEDLVDQLESAIRELRGSVADLHDRDTFGRLAQEITRSLAHATRSLGHTPTLQVSGALDSVSPVVSRQLVPALREALSNVARHADATCTQVSVVADASWVTLTVDDDGIGIEGHPVPGDGLSNLAGRAARLGGSLSVSRRGNGGTRVRWRVPASPG